MTTTPDTAMEENLEVFFCDLCNTSVPQHDLDTGAGVRVKGRVIGACCLRELRGSAPASSPAPASTKVPAPGGAGLLGATVIVLAAIAGATMFLELRLTEDVGGVNTAVERVDAMVGEHQDRIRGVEESLGTTARAADVAGLGAKLTEIGKTLQERELRLQGAMSSSSTLIEQLGRDLDVVKGNQGELLERLRSVREDLRALGQELAAALARPRAEPEPAKLPDSAPAPATTPEASSGLPPELQHEIGRLADEDPGTRFEAVDKLVQSGNMAVLDDLIPMAKDSDLFVRRLVIEGLANFHSPKSVDVLLTALADPETIVRHTAYGALLKITGQNIPFDPDGKKEERRSAQRKWQEWWRKNREGF